MGKRRSRGEGSMWFWEDKGLWVGEITIKGKTRRKYDKTQKEVRAWLLQQRKLAEEGRLVDDKRITLGEFIDLWLEDVARPALRPSTLAAHQSIIKTHIKPALGSVRLSELTPLQLQTFCSQKLSSGLSNRTVKYIRTIIHQALDHAMELGMVSRNVADRVKTPAPEKKPITPLPRNRCGGCWTICSKTACSPYMWYIWGAV